MTLTFPVLTLPVSLQVGSDNQPFDLGTVTVDPRTGNTEHELNTAMAALLRGVADQLDPPTPVDPEDLRADLRDVITPALAAPVPCPRCDRTAPCRCIGDRRPARTEAVVQAVLGLLAGN